MEPVRFISPEQLDEAFARQPPRHPASLDEIPAVVWRIADDVLRHLDEHDERNPDPSDTDR